MSEAERGHQREAGHAPAHGGDKARADGTGQNRADGTGQAPAHGGAQAVAAALRRGATTMFTLSGGHVFPLYDGAVRADPPMRIVDVRHEQTAVFAAEATARLGRVPGLAVLTAGPGVTNGVSAVTTAHFNGSPVVVLGGRAPDYRWGSGSLQEIDHPQLLAPVTKRAWTEHEAGRVGRSVDEAFRLAATRHRGPVFLDITLEALFGAASAASLAEPGRTEAGTAEAGRTEAGTAEAGTAAGLGGPGLTTLAAGGGATAGGTAADGPAGGQREVPDPDSISAIARLLAAASRPVLVLGSDVWLDRADQAARLAAEELRLPVIANGQGRGVLPAGH